MLRAFRRAGAVCAISVAVGVGAARGDDAASRPAPEGERAAHAASDANAREGTMTSARLVALLRREKLGPQSDGPNTAFYVGNARVYATLDEANDRMRFAIPLGPAGKMDTERIVTLLKQNYHAMGDVRFAINRNVIWLVYVHRLSTLTEEDALSAINQLAHHARRYGQP